MDPTLIISPELILADYMRALAEDKVQNGHIYPYDSSHARGIRSPGCRHCVKLNVYEHLLGMRPSPDFLPGEQERALRQTRRYENIRIPEAQINEI